MTHVTSLNGLALHNSWVTIGTFDGVHKGHQALIHTLVEGAHRHNQPAVVVTFYPHPAVVLGKGPFPGYLTSPEERARYLSELGVDWVITLTFDHAMSSLSAQDFMNQLAKHLGIRYLVIGYDFALGRGREGNPERLQAIGQQLGYEVILAQPVQAGEQPISSSQIRQFIQQGNLETANQWLGRLYAVEGIVVRGDGRGRVLGFPTANLSYWPEKLLPANGVYATWAWVGKERLAAVTNLGVRPTFASPLHYRFLEAHLLDFEGDLYEQTLTLEFVARLRPEQRFSSLEDLKAQIQKDIRTAREILNHVP
ncbi:bifunctional riboflavin kinase/FAD synthetase [Thermanaerothrix sp. 4228-RoL]|jgi:riboflavin kinase/FMN adenylyltransferase|uniref:Riboflavin biosynthesis protein n=1 Tax=Thermanaerothrix solaris TaxID=3058434 RepID=A0ABU3NLU2_9CHLR|nr:bifunctional riboflavin kinase/FAD synthetase [Thermanaerothrix sp. 4228-RoL]MDT8897825.1 bifunctional riboflavin kinase/FAD synthetase [Thermanaerothrix sp. 4228-RoL]